MSGVHIALVVGGFALVCIVATRFIDRTNANDGARAEALEREIRIGLPLGSSLPAVEDFLSHRRAEWSFDASSKSVRAIIRRLKGSTILTSKSLTLRFDFDQDLKLKNLDTKLVYTGP